MAQQSCGTHALWWSFSLSITLIAAIAQASVVTVPDDVPMIQQALNAGPDTVFIRPGDYPESPVVWQAVRILSTTTGGERPRMAGIMIQPSVLTDTLLFRALAFVAPVVIDNASACRIYFESCDLTQGLRDQSSDSRIIDLHFSKCVIAGAMTLYLRNVCTIDSSIVSGTIDIANDPFVVIRNCVFQGAGDGIAIQTDRSSGALIEGNTIADYAQGMNAATEGEAIVQDNIVEYCSHLGIAVGHSDAAVRRNIVRHCGMGMGVSSDRILMVAGNRVEDCTGRGLWVNPYFGRSEIVENLVYRSGGNGIEIVGDSEYSEILVARNTSAYNQGAGISWEVAGGVKAELVANIGYANGGYGVQWWTDYATAVRCNDWYGNAGGDVFGRAPSPSDLSADPLFCDGAAGDFRLLATSPVVNVADCGQIGALSIGCSVTATVVSRFTAERAANGIRILWELADSPIVRVAWLERAEDGSGPWIRPVTVQSHEGVATVELDERAAADRAYWYRLVALENGAKSVIGPPIGVARVEGVVFEIVGIRPNPASGPVLIAFGVKVTSEIGIDVFDVQGRLVATPARGVWPAGKHRVVWNGSSGSEAAPAGTYLVRYRFPGGEDRRRIVKVP